MTLAGVMPDAHGGFRARARIGVSNARVEFIRMETPDENPVPPDGDVS